MESKEVYCIKSSGRVVLEGTQEAKALNRIARQNLVDDLKITCAVLTIQDAYDQSQRQAEREAQLN